MQLDNVRNRIDISELKFLAKTKQSPHLPWAIINIFPFDLRLKVQRNLTTLSNNSNGKSVLKTVRLNDVLFASYSNFDER